MMSAEQTRQWVELSEELTLPLTDLNEATSGLYLSKPEQVRRAIAQLGTGELSAERPLALGRCSLEELYELSGAQLTLRTPRVVIPGALLNVVRLRLLGEGALEPVVWAAALYELMRHLPEGPVEQASWFTHCDGSLELCLKGQDWSVRISAQGSSPSDESPGPLRMQLSGLNDSDGAQLEQLSPLAPALELSELRAWGGPSVARWREALALLRVAERSGVAQRAPSPWVHPSAQLHPTVELSGEVSVGAHTKIWHFSKLLGPVELGPHCNLGQNVVVERHAKLGRNVKVQNNVSIYSGVILEDDVFCGPSMVFTNVGTPRSHYPRRGAYEETRVKRGASIGANATVVCGSTIGRYALIGAGAVVTKDVPDYALAFGNPARVQGWVCYCGEGLALGRGERASLGQAEAECGECGRRYQRVGLEVSERSDA